jgi:hypothetical protein
MSLITGPITVSFRDPHISLEGSQDRLIAYFCSQHMLWYEELKIAFRNFFNF